MEQLKFNEWGSICQLVIFLVVAVMGGAALIIGLTMNTKYGPQAQQPLFIRLNSFSISNLNLSDPATSQAKWEASLVFGNHHKSLDISIDGFESFVHYTDNEGREDHALSCAPVAGIHLRPKEEKPVEMEFSGIGSGCGRGSKLHVDDKVVRDIENGVGGNGTVRFGIVMDFPRVSYKRGPWSWVYQLTPRCSDLDVMFARGKSAGSLSVDRPRFCLVPSVK